MFLNKLEKEYENFIINKFIVNIAKNSHIYNNNVSVIFEHKDVLFYKISPLFYSTLLKRFCLVDGNSFFVKLKNDLDYDLFFDLIEEDKKIEIIKKIFFDCLIILNNYFKEKYYK